MQTIERFLLSTGAKIRRMRYLMGTFVEIEASADTQDKAHAAVEAAFAEMRRIERVFSKYLPASMVSRINDRAGVTPVEVPPEVEALLESSLEFARLAQGAFDITVGPLMDLWAAAEKRGFAPSCDEIQEVSHKVGYRYLQRNDSKSTVFFGKKGMKVDFGGIGKGYAIDRAVSLLRAQGIAKAWINAGGNIFCLDDEEHSQVAVRDPLEPEKNIALVWLKDSAVATSANNERFFKIEGTRVGHLIDPRSGSPVDHEVLSVTILSPSAQTADVLSTAAFILGPEEGMRLIEKIPEVEGLMVLQDRGQPRLLSSSGLQQRLDNPPVFR